MYDRLLKYCESKNYNVTIYIDKIKNRFDNDNRIELMHLKNDVLNNKYSTIVIDSVEHFSRDIITVLELINFFKSHNCDIECINDTNIHSNEEIFREGDKIMKFENNGLGECIVLKHDKKEDYSIIYSLLGKQFVVAYGFNEETKSWINGHYYNNLDDAYNGYQKLTQKEELER